MFDLTDPKVASVIKYMKTTKDKNSLTQRCYGTVKLDIPEVDAHFTNYLVTYYI